MTVRTLKPLLIALVFAGAAGARSACAADTGAYVGANVGGARYQDSVNGVSGDGNAVTGKAYGGYQINRYAGVEIGYADLGHVSNATGRIDGRAEYVDAVGTLPLTENFSLLGSVGMNHVNFDTSNGDGNGNGLKLGVGAQYALSNNVALRAQADRYHADAFGEKPDVDQFTVGVKVAF